MLRVCLALVLTLCLGLGFGAPQAQASETAKKTAVAPKTLTSKAQVAKIKPAKEKPKPDLAAKEKSATPSVSTPSLKDKAFPDGGVTPAEMASVLKSLGHKAQIVTDKNNEPVIVASFLAGDVDIAYRIFFFGCKAGRCASIQYFVAFDGQPTKVAKWNEENRYARAYVLAKKIHIEYDVDVEEGATTKALRNSLERWKAVMIAAVGFLA